MAHSPLHKVDPAKVAKFSFKRELCNYLYYSESLGRCAGYIYKTDETTRNKIIDILKGSESATVKKKDRLYVLPGNTLPLKRIKTYAKNAGAFITTDIEKATAIIGNNNLHHDISYDEPQAKLACLMFSSDSYSYIKDNTEEYETTLNETFEDLIKSSKVQVIHDDFVNDAIPCILSMKLIDTLGFDTNIEKCNLNETYLYPQALEVLYQILAKKIPVISQEYLNENAHSNLDLSKPYVYKNLNDMLESSDSDNRSLGRELLIHAKITDDIMSLYHLWLLSNKHYHYIDSARDKNKNHFIELTNFDEIRYLTLENFIVQNKEQLTPHAFNLMMLQLIDNSSLYPSDSTFYELTHSSIGGFVYRLKAEWKIYLEPKKIEENEYTR